MRPDTFNPISFEEFKERHFKGLKENLAKAKVLKEIRIKNHPSNGYLGWWKVVGIRNSAFVKASSAREAIQKTSEFVGDWEDPEPHFIGEELPDVFN